MEFLILWVGFSIAIWIMAGNRNRSSIGWFLGSLIISPLLCAVLLLVLGSNKDEQFDEKHKVKNEESKDENEWTVIRKYVQEVIESLEYLSKELDSNGIELAEEKLKELFFVVGKDGLTERALKIIIDDVKEEQKSSLEKDMEDDVEKETAINEELIEFLKKNKKVGFSKTKGNCEVCNSMETQQTISGKFVCSTCRTKHL